jgi:hypothetical protein
MPLLVHARLERSCAPRSDMTSCVQGTGMSSRPAARHSAPRFVGVGGASTRLLRGHDATQPSESRTHAAAGAALHHSSNKRM